MKLLLGIPSGGAPTQPFLESIARLTLPATVTTFDRFVVTGNFVPAQRELIVERALEKGADVLLMCDDDMVIPPEAPAALLDVLQEQPRCALAGALYYSRDGFRPMAVSHWRGSDTTSASIPGFDRTPVEVDGVGFGCVAVRMDAVRELEPPYFPAHVFLEPQSARVRVCDEDYLFCERLRQRGWTIALHAGVRCGHYDRAGGRTFPVEWESAATTAQPRMAVVQDGVQRLLPLQDVPSLGEDQQRAHVTYVRPRV